MGLVELLHRGSTLIEFHDLLEVGPDLINATVLQLLPVRRNLAIFDGCILIEITLSDRLRSYAQCMGKLFEGGFDDQDALDDFRTIAWRCW